MILDGNQRGGARDLAVHLMKPENEHVEIHEIRGFVSDTIMGALREAEAVSRGTKCMQHLYSLSLSPPETLNVPIAAFEDAVNIIEEKLGLSGHPRIVVFHEKQGRRHAHCVWSRIDGETMKAVRMSHDRRKLADVSRQLYMEHGWKMPEGLIDPDLRNPLNFDRQEWFQAQRAGKDPRDIKSALQQCWQASDSGKAFRSALEQRGYFLATGDSGRVVAIDTKGEIYAVARWIGEKTKDFRLRMADCDDLPTVAEAHDRIATLVQKKLDGFAASATDEFAQAAALLEGLRLAMVRRHRVDRRQLREAHEARSIVEARRRADRVRKGLLGLWDRVTGQHTKVRSQNEKEAADCAARDIVEKQMLIEEQLRERQRLQKEIVRERKQHVRELARVKSWKPPDRHPDGSDDQDGTQRRQRGRSLPGPAR